jgi:putative ABC transport system permease protein
MVKSVDRVLAFLFQVIAGMGVLGYAVALAASLWANVDRKRKELALLRLVGFPSAAVVVFPAAQAMLISLFGTGLSLLAYEAVSATLNAVLSSNLAAEEFICRLLPAHATVAVLTTLAVGLVASAVGAFHASSIDPADSLRDL